MAASLPEGSPIAIGQVIRGKYRVDAPLGMGGMGFVVRGTHLELLQPVAIKFLLPDLARDANATARFIREARAAARLSSDNVGRVLDVDSSGPLPFIVMEFLTGTDLAELVATRGPLPVELAVDYTLQACDALSEAHALGIIHRDLKPHNLFLAQRANGTSRVKVLDFGISKVAPSISGESRALTSTSAVMGSPSYMSPEQMVTSREVDARSDIWSMGVTLFELLTGRMPFEGETTFELGAKVLHQPAPSVRSLRPEISPAFEAAIFRCLEKEPAARFQSIAELVSALRNALAGGAQAPGFAKTELAQSGSNPRLAVPVVVSAPPQPPPHARTGGTWESAQTQLAPSSARGGMIAFGAVAGVLLAAGLVFGGIALKSKHKPETTTTTTAATPPAETTAVTTPQPSAPAPLPSPPPSTTAAASASAAPPSASSAAPHTKTPTVVRPRETPKPPSGAQGLPDER